MRWRQGGQVSAASRWRIDYAGVEKGAKTGLLTMAYRLRWCLTDAGVQMEQPNFLTLALVKR
jgi:hypothetical protein